MSFFLLQAYQALIVPNLLESFTGIELSLDIINNSSACQDCAASIEKYDKFVHLSGKIQKRITEKLNATHTELVFIKEEPEFETVTYSEHSQATSSQMITKYEPMMQGDESFESKSDEEDSDDYFPSSQPSSAFFQCDKCHKKFAERTSLINHLKTHSPTQQVLRCNLCSHNFHTESSFEVHKILNHSTNSPKGPFTCPLCEKVYDTREGFRNHYHQHKPAKNFLCIRCGTMFKNKKYLKRHMMIHDDIRPFKCEFEGCSKSFRTATNLKL